MSNLINSNISYNLIITVVIFLSVVNLFYRIEALQHSHNYQSFDNTQDISIVDDFSIIEAVKEIINHELDSHVTNTRDHNYANPSHANLTKIDENKELQQSNNGHYCIHDHIVQKRYDHFKQRIAEKRNIPENQVSENELRRIIYPRVSQVYEQDKKQEQSRTHGTNADNPYNNDYAPVRFVFNTSQIMNDPSGETCYPGEPNCNSKDVVTEEKLELLKGLLDSAVDILSPIKVQRASGNLNIGNPGQCSEVDVPESWRQSGVPNADIAILVMMRPTGQNVAGYASDCVSDQYGRTVLGHLNISPRTVQSDQKKYGAAVVAHETIHALGFSSGKFSQFINEDKEQRNNVVTKGSRTINGYDMTLNYISTPAVTSFANEYFGCNNELPGGELEEYGGSGTAGSHWEQRIFYNELMTGSIQIIFGEPSVLSPLTLSALVDSGWFQADLDTQKTKITWGKGRGCSFANGDCSNWGTWQEDQVQGYFCTQNDAPSCTHDRMGKGYCYVTERSDLIDYYYHIPETRKVGFLPLMDFCTHIVGYSNGDCRDPSNAVDSRKEAHGESWGEYSRCFRADLIATGYSSGQDEDIKCYPHACGDGTLYIKIGDKWLKCPKEGSSGSEVFGYSGGIHCPAASDMCGESETSDNYDQVQQDGLYEGTLQDLKDTVLDKLSIVPIWGWVAIGGGLILLCCLCIVASLIRRRNKKKNQKWKPERTYDLRNQESPSRY